MEAQACMEVLARMQMMRHKRTTMLRAPGGAELLFELLDWPTLQERDRFVEGLITPFC